MYFVVIFTFAAFGLVTVAAFSHQLSQSVAVGVVTEVPLKVLVLLLLHDIGVGTDSRKCVNTGLSIGLT